MLFSRTVVTSALLLAFSLGLARAQALGDAALTRVAEVLALNGREAGVNPRPVRLRGVVLSVNVAQNHLTLHDGASSVGVDLTQPLAPLKLGDDVEILGQTKTAVFGSAAHPRVLATSVQVKGTAPLPKPREVDMGVLNSFQHFDQWVTLECYVMEWMHVDGELLVRTVSRGGYAGAYVRMPDAASLPANLYGARLRLTGINAGARNQNNALFVPSPAQIEVLEPGTAGIFDTPLASIADLVERKVEYGRRWRARGVVAARTQERKVLLVSPEGAMTVYLVIPRGNEIAGAVYGDAGRWPEPQPGDVVEVVGSCIESNIPDMHSQGLTWCHLRVVGHEEPPKPRPVDLSTLLSWRDHDEWCSVEGIVTGWMQRGSARSYALVDAHGCAIFHVWDAPQGNFPKARHGARVRFTGISRSRLRNAGDSLLVPSPAFVEVVKQGTIDPFDVPEASMQEILTRLTPSAERVRTHGVVIGRPSPGILYLRGPDGAMCVSLQVPWAKPAYFDGEFFADAGPLPNVNIGDEVEIMGSPIQPKAGLETAGYDLYQTHVRQVGKAGTPTPIATTLREVAGGRYTNDLVEVRGRVVSLQQAPVGAEWRTTMLLEADGVKIPVVYQGQQVEGFGRLSPDLDVQVNGIVDRLRPGSPRELWIMDDTVIRILGVSQALLKRRLWLWGGGGGVVVVLLLVWIAMLRRNASALAAAAAELKAASDSAHASEQRWKLLFEQSPLSVQIFSPDGQTKQFNKAWSKLFRLNDEQAYAFNVLTAPDLVASGAVNHIRKAFEGEVVQVPPVPYPIPSDPPETRWIGGLLYPLKDEAGQITEVVVIHHDITDTKRAEQALIEINQLLDRRVQERTTELQKTQADLQDALRQERELGELKTRFVTMVSHEFRTPLGIIMSAVELLQHYSDRLPEDEKERQLNEIQTSTKHMGGLMEQVLLLGRAEAGKLTCRPQPLDLKGFAERIIDETQSVSNRKCPIHLLTEGALEGASVDEALLRHILGNLVANAVKYSPEGGDVTVHIRRSGLQVAFDVVDRGIGIPEKDRARLFEAFHRCSNVGDTPGTGLGLVIVKRCVDLHAGAISFQSKVGQGTTFTVKLPLFTSTKP